MEAAKAQNWAVEPKGEKKSVWRAEVYWCRNVAHSFPSTMIPQARLCGVLPLNFKPLPWTGSEAQRQIYLAPF
jgi:hypothetical protein